MTAKKKTPRKKKEKAKSTAQRKQGGELHVWVSPDLEERLKGLAKSMDKSMDQMLVQALNEFADMGEITSASSRL